MKASCTASSAAAMSPKTRTRTATARPYSARKMRSISGRSTTSVLERTHFNRQRDGAGQLARPFERRVEIRRFDDREAADVLLALGVRAVGHPQVTVLQPDDGGRAGLVQAAAEYPDAML